MDEIDKILTKFLKSNTPVKRVADLVFLEDIMSQAEAKASIEVYKDNAVREMLDRIQDRLSGELGVRLKDKTGAMGLHSQEYLWVISDVKAVIQDERNNLKSKEK